MTPIAKPLNTAPMAEASQQASRRESNWIYPGLSACSSERFGRALVATEAIPKDTLLIVYGGHVLTLEDFNSLSPALQHYPYQVEEELFLGPVREDELGLGDLVNHSCAPNAGFQGAIHLVALRDIKSGELITMDYATCVSSDLDAFRMDCACGESSCRGVVTGADWRSLEIQSRLLPNYQPYLQRKVRDLRLKEPLTNFQSGDPRAANQDRVVDPKLSGLAGVCNLVTEFARQAISHEWPAIIISCLSALPSNLLTCVIVVWGARWLKGFEMLSSEAAYVSAVSLLTGFVGYATYLAMYYGGMVYKERRDLYENGVFSWGRLREKWRVITYDFAIHLPSDFFVLPLMGAGQGGLYVAGLSQFWSIFWAQAIADAAYAVKEPFFWHGAKKLAQLSSQQTRNVGQASESMSLPARTQ